MDLIGELFRRKKSKEIFAHQHQNPVQGYSNGGRPAYGYQRKPIEVEGKPKVIWELHPEETEVVRKTFSRRLQGDGVRETARRLTREGYVDRKSRPFAHNAILEWFLNPYRYVGYRCWYVHDSNMKRNPKTECPLS